MVPYEVRKISVKKLFLLSLFTIIVILFSFSIFSDYVVINTSHALLVSFLINILISFYFLISSTKCHSYSFEVMFWIFGFLFFGLAPLIQYYMGWTPWGLVSSNSDILKTNQIITIWYFSYLVGKIFGGFFHDNIVLHSEANHKPLYQEINYDRAFIVAGYAIVVFCIMVYIHGFKGFIYRNYTNVDLSDNTSIDLLTYHIFRNFILYSFTIFLISYKHSKKHVKTTCMLGLLFVISCFPTGLSRYMLAAFYLGVLIIMLPEKISTSVFFTIIFFLGLTVVFPLSNVFRAFTSFSDIKINAIKKIFDNTYLTEHYDAHAMIISALHYIERFGFTFGKQTIGVLLFFIPRSIWTGKTIGSGALVIQSLNQFDFSNVSMPLVGEAFLEFSWFGVIIVGLLVGIVTKILDDTYWSQGRGVSVLKIVYPFMVFYFFFMQRGDLMSSWAYMFANILIGSCISHFVLNNR